MLEERLQLIRNRRRKREHLQLLAHPSRKRVDIIQETVFQRHVSFIHDQHIRLVTPQCTFRQKQILNASGSPDHDLRLLVFKSFDFPLPIASADIQTDPKIRFHLVHYFRLFIDLCGQLTGWRRDDRLHLIQRSIDLFKDRNQIGMRLSRTCPGKADNILSLENGRNRFLLNRRRLCKMVELNEFQRIFTK